MQTQSSSANAPQKSKKVYAILAFFFCTLGVHNFWAGHKKRAITELILAGVVWLVFWMALSGYVEAHANEALTQQHIDAMRMIGYIRFIPWIWFFIDIFTVKKDGNGVPFK